MQANILVDSTPHARIADFGVAVASHYTGLPTQPGSRGTAAYKAPECIDTGEEDDPAATFLPTPASDVYATAVLIWEVLLPPYVCAAAADEIRSCSRASGRTRAGTSTRSTAARSRASGHRARARARSSKRTWTRSGQSSSAAGTRT
jgi:serine/threonine protein kinase